MARSFYGRVGAYYTDEITENLLKLTPAIRQQVIDALLICGGIIHDRAYELANVSPGIQGHGVDGSHMRDRIEIHVIESTEAVEIRIGIDLAIIPYAPHQEFGDRGKPFLRPAIDESRQECHDILQSVLIDGAEAHTLVRFRRFA